MVGSFVKIVAGVALGVALLIWLFQERMIFFPRPLEHRPAPRSNVEEITIPVAGGVKLRGWLVKGRGAPAPLVIYFGGNAEEVSWLGEVAGNLAGWSLLLVNYRGYGESEGKPSERELLADAIAIHDYARQRPDVDPGRIVAMGRSLGSGVAVHLAAERSLRGVILVSSYDSLVAVAKHHYPFLPISLMLRHRFDSVTRASRIDTPLLCLVASEDRVIPASHSRTLFEAWRGPKTWHEIPRADHDGIASEPGYWSAIADFLKSMR
jgi:pimeloyl-ACP methyl ester carboxylesterase